MNENDQAKDDAGGDRRRARPGFVKQQVQGTWRELIRVNTSDRRWEMPLAAALSSGLPLMVGA
ncbi:MAG: hypothetical protein ACN6OD_06565 [Alcaligenes sp.]